MIKKMETPAHLFINYWVDAATWKASLIRNVGRPSEAFTQELIKALSEDDGESSAAQLYDLIELSTDGKKKGRILILLETIDNFFYQIHPRALHHPLMSYINLGKNHWLKFLQTKRTLHGCYLSLGDRQLIPKGPLTRDFRPVNAANADCFRDRFFSLSVVQSGSSVNEVPVSISVKVRAAGSPNGIASEGIYKDRRVAFIPLAEEDTHLDVAQRLAGGVSFVDFKAARCLDVVEKTLDAISRIGYSDIIIAPELVVSEGDSRLIGAGIRKDAGRFRAFLAGSGHTIDKENDQAWNESSFYNGAGAVVFRQRKIWLSDINKKRAAEFGLDITAPTLMEDNASGEDFIVADLDGFGRCVVLICQDLNASPLAEFVIGNYQPDWVFVPVLDVGVEIGRWFHKRILELSDLSPARFLVSSSLSLAKRAKYDDVACGLAFGPLDVGDSHCDCVCDCNCAYVPDPKRISLVKVGADDQKGFGVVDWQEAWKSTRIYFKKGD